MQKNRRPITYFKGSQEEASKLSDKQIMAKLGKSRAKFSNKEQLMRAVEKIREALRATEKLPVRKSPLIARVETKHGTVFVKFAKGSKGTILVTPQPVTHGITGTHGSTYNDLCTILTSGFVGGLNDCDKHNASVSRNRSRKGVYRGGEWQHREFIGDNYTLEIVAPVKTPESPFIDRAKPEQVLSVNIEINPNIPKAEQKERIKKYREQIAKKFGVPVKFIESKWGQ
jgi:hypothetical protein